MTSTNKEAFDAGSIPAGCFVGTIWPTEYFDETMARMRKEGLPVAPGLTNLVSVHNNSRKLPQDMRPGDLHRLGKIYLVFSEPTQAEH